MSETVNLPALGESVTEGTVSRWLKEVGDEVAVDEPLVEVSTDKVDTEIPSPVAGVLEEILVEEDDTVEVGAPLATIGDGEGGGSSDDSDDDAEAEEDASEAAAADESDDSDDSEEKEEVKADKGSSSGETTEVTLPALGESVTEGTISRWLKEVGDEVEVDEPLLEVSTDKVDTEIPSPVAGTLVEIKAEEDETVEVGAVLALVGDGSGSSDSDGGSADDADTEDESDASAEQIEEKATQAEAPEKTEEAVEEAADEDADQDKGGAKPEETSASEEDAKRDDRERQDADTPTASEPGQGYVTPLVRRLAKQHNVDLSTVRGTGVGGRIRKQDVLAASLAAGEAASGTEKTAAEAPAAASAPAAAVESSVDPSVRGNTEKAPRIRQVIAQRMRESLDLSTQLTQVHEVDLTRIVNLRAQAKASFQERNGVKLTYLPFIAQAVAEALKQHPKLNASFSEDNKEITYHSSEDLAVAVDTEKGLLVPVIKDAGSLNLSGIAQKIADVADRARTNKIGADELSGGTFSITNIGSVGALFDTPIINQPQVAILGTGAIVKRPMVVTDADGNDSIAIRHMMYLSLTYDHRLVDGADAGRFLMTLRQRLEAGEFAHELGL
ncbi:2-oxoglutarate dehydrogenase, E2 component, dihydrolipoamide succinyltransferase [Micrococcus sp. FDAARGOS_333]|uniref:2-oxoglutarate dehydrogenase, E2 component, dihydrolipoamide succinyltransferase n=1 Tax=Micrococcus sp. FDAARGOS_333 TaxID=1930558 RepID=UPI000B4E34BD|nr:2-oxoglutarate dehydrogenase, E2 component, dihydrolipoamide succinyltransferase [Micrococcus sp. FDAARGOS_333]PNL18152.1 2-oxoglutarate dehydrogenase, E2 component, dihydrolipoamide succinyltransferase [Micrococcus sp. FDAARGOS_333]